MKSNIPIKHHYIPRFLLRPFCFDDELLHFYDTKTKSIKDRKIEEVFMERNLYMDAFNNPDNPVKLELDFSKYEGEVAKTIARFRNDDEIILRREEEEALALFLAIMPFRSEQTRKTFSDNNDELFKQYYSVYNKEGDLEDFWKRNLEYLVQCRSLKEAFESKDIADPIKIFMFRDAAGLFGYSFTIAERRGKEDFIIGDAFPTRINVEMTNGGEMPFLYFCPISPQRVLIMVTNILRSAPEHFWGFDKDLFKFPRYCDGQNASRHKVCKVYEPDVRKINSIISDSSTEGYIFRNQERVSIDIFEEIYAEWRKSPPVKYYLK